MEGSDRDDPGYSGDSAALPLHTRDVFPAHLLPCFKYETLTKVQQRVLRAAFAGNDNLMVSAPTGSGKTAVLEAAFLQAFERSQGSPTRKALYIAPVKALLQERLQDWRARFGESTLGMEFVELSGDTRAIDEDAVDRAHVLLTTPEKWDAITRSGAAKARLVGAVELLLLDEIHHIGDASRGATLEAVVLRMINLCKREHEEFSWQPIRDMRIVGLSATFSNAADIASWIECPAQSCFVFGSDYRPVPLSTRIVGCGDASNDFVFERNLDSRVLDIIRQFSNGKPSLVFCNSRMATIRLASHLSTQIRRLGIFDPMKRDRLESLGKIEESDVGVKVLAALKSGVAYHHAGLATLERSTVENLFKASKLPILWYEFLFNTSIMYLAIDSATQLHELVGSRCEFGMYDRITRKLFNASTDRRPKPAHLVVIKSTRLYQGAGGYISYPKSQLLQMIGRAGRPGLDSSGVAVILTEDKCVEELRSLLSGTAPINIESQLAGNVIEILNTEIALGTVGSRTAAKLWLQQTYFARCLKRLRNSPAANEDIMSPSLEVLAQASMIKVRTDGGMEATIAGCIMSQNYISFETMKRIVHEGQKARTFEDLLIMLSKCVEVRIPMRRQEKNELIQLNETATKFHVINPDGTTSINSDAAKTNILIQAVLGKSKLADSYSGQELTRAIDEAVRILGAMVEVLQRADSGEALCTVLRMRRCLELRSWDDSVGRYSLQQISAIDPPTAAALEYIGIRSIRQLAEASAERIDSFLRRQPPIGEHLINQARGQKQFYLCATWVAKQRGPLKTLRISVTSSSCKMIDSATLIAWTETDLLKFQPNISHGFNCDVFIPDDYHKKIHVRLLQENFIGLDSRLEIAQEATTHEPRTPLALASNEACSKDHEFHEPAALGEKSSTILRSILQLESHHANAKQQKMPKFLIKTMPSEASSSDRATRTAPPSSASAKADRVPQQCSKKRHMKNVSSKTTAIPRSVRRCVEPVKHPSHSIKTPTTSLNPFDKFRFTDSSKRAPCVQKRTRDQDKLIKPISKSQDAIVSQIPANASSACTGQQTQFQSHQPSSSGYVHPFMKAYLRDKTQTLSTGEPSSLLQSARSSIEYSFLQRFVEQPEIQTDSSGEDDGTRDAPQYASAAPSIVQTDNEHPFDSIFF